MLVLHRRKTQTILIGGDITITIADISTGHVRVGIDAPDDVLILRGELDNPSRRIVRKKKFVLGKVRSQHAEGDKRAAERPRPTGPGTTGTEGGSGGHQGHKGADG